MKYMNGFWVPDDDHMLVLDLLGPGGAHDVDLFAKVRKYTLDQPKRVFVDVGANIGRWALHFHEDYDRVFCFEPAYYNLECLKRNTEHQTNIHLREYGLGIKKHKASLTVTKPGELACTLATEDENGDVEIQRLDDQNIPDCDLLKVDVEGYETEVFKGGEELIKRCQPLICVERDGTNYKRLGKRKKESHEYLQSIGYTMMYKLTRDCIYGIPNIHQT